MKRLPSVFIAHALPAPARQRGAEGKAWAALGSSLPEAAAILIASAQWESSVPMLAGDRPRFAPGALELARRARTLLGKAGFVAGINGLRGLDRDACEPLLRAYPKPGVPVVQLSMQPLLGPAHHVAVGEALRDLPGDGVLVVGSGDLTAEHFHPFFVALGAAAEGARPERIAASEPGVPMLDAYLFH